MKHECDRLITQYDKVCADLAQKEKLLKEAQTKVIDSEKRLTEMSVHINELKLYIFDQEK